MEDTRIRDALSKARASRTVPPAYAFLKHKDGVFQVIAAETGGSLPSFVTTEDIPSLVGRGIMVICVP